jgi:biopolymer transport protein ExbD
VAGSSQYKDDSDDEAITDINVTPFVDVVLVLLVVFMVTAKLIVSRGVEIEPPKASSGGDVQSTLRIAVQADGAMFVNGDEYKEDAAALARIKEIAASTSKPKAIITGDHKTAYGGVMRAIDLATQAGLPIALENKRPD